MAYTLTPDTQKPILDNDGDPMAEGSTTVVITDPSKVGFHAVGGILHLFGGALGSTDVTVGGVTHEVTVSASPFDWDLGAAIPK